MKWIFSRRKAESVTKAKERLQSVIRNDRINTVDDKTMDKIRKDITAVLLKYVKDSENLCVTVSVGQAEGVILNATVKSAV